MKLIISIVIVVLVLGGVVFFVMMGGSRDDTGIAPPTAPEVSPPAPPVAGNGPVPEALPPSPQRDSAAVPQPSSVSPQTPPPAPASLPPSVQPSAPPPPPPPPPPPVQPLRISSSAFGSNQTIPKKYTCDGQDLSPPLTFLNTPSGTASLALIMDDPDAPDPKFVHWMFWNVNPSLGSFSENSVPSGVVQGKNGFGAAAYGGPCPPPGEAAHRYVFTLYALNATLSLSSTATRAQLEAALTGHIISQAQLAGLYASP